MADTAKDAMNAALDRLKWVEIHFMEYIYSDDNYEDARLVREILTGLHETKKLVRLCEYRARNEREES